MGVQDLSGQTLDGRYHIQDRLAEGAMGVVYRGTRLNLERAVAIKVMHASLPEQMEGRKRFEREAKLMAKLEHPHCVSIIDYGIHNAKPYVVMELVRGRDLCELLAELGRFDVTRAVDIMRQVLSALAHAHEQGIIHRDIKPANIMVTPKAPLGLHVRILDFGLARLLESSASTSRGLAVGTPSYMAPEQCRGEELDARVDVYSCGVVLFEMLTGRKPFVARDPIEIVKKHIEEMPPRLGEVAPGNYGALEDVVARALSKQPDDRFPTAVAMAEALEAAVSGRASSEPTMQLDLRPHTKDDSTDVPITVGSSIHIKPQKPDSSVRRELPVSRTRWLVLAALLLAGSAIAFGIVWSQQLGADDVPPDARAIVVAPKPEVADAPPPTPHDPAQELAAQAAELAAAGKTQAAIDSLVKARKVYPDSSELALTLGKLYFGKMWWTDGLVHLRDAVKLDPTLKGDPELVKMVVRAFNMTPSYNSQLANFVVELGDNAVPALQETASSHPNPPTRSRAQSMLKRIQR